METKRYIYLYLYIRLSAILSTFHDDEESIRNMDDFSVGNTPDYRRPVMLGFYEMQDIKKFPLPFNGSFWQLKEQGREFQTGLLSA